MFERIVEEIPELREVAPALPPDVRQKLYDRLRDEHARSERDGSTETFSEALRQLINEWEHDPHSLMLRTTCLLVADLIDQGWACEIAADRVLLKPPSVRPGPDLSREVIKARIRRALRVGRDRQLAEPSVRQFLRRMERTTKRPEGRFSIQSVIDDGRELERQLLKLRRLSSEEQERQLARLIDPVVESCESGERCSATGLNKLDIWRYFRHTWSLEYRAVPGRQFPLLIRNAARPNRPVIGIALLASPVMRLRIRDSWIGWTPPAWAKGLGSGRWDPAEAAHVLLNRLDTAISEVRSDDLATDQELTSPSDRLLFRLELQAASAVEKRTKQLQELYAANRTSRHLEVRDATDDTDWRKHSEDHLFVRKRAEILVSLLRARMVFEAAGLRRDPYRAFRELIASETGWRALDTTLTEIRKVGLASQVADVSVCGAVHPYNELLGGKLVALVLHSREVRGYTRPSMATR